MKLKTLSFTTKNGDNLGVNYQNGESVYAGLNHLYEEICWYYPKAGSDFNDRYVCYNYQDGHLGNWFFI